MQITVCVAVTPSTDTRIKIAADGKSIDMADVKLELNPYDEFALEEAIRIKEKLGTGEVQVLTVGDGSQKEELRKCLARGADTATILVADTRGVDSGAVAGALVEHVRSGPSRLVLFGKQAVDGDNAQVPHFVAAGLGWPVIAKVSHLELNGDDIVAHREIEGGIEVIHGKLPCVLSAEKGLNEPRYPSLKGIMAAKKKPLNEVPVALGASKLTVEKLELPPARPQGRIVGEGTAAVAILIDLLKNESKVI